VPLYPFCCEHCGNNEDEFMRMNSVVNIVVCNNCGGTRRRRYTVPFDHSENTFKAHWNEQLSTEPDPVYIRSRREMEERMQAMNVRPYERGDGDQYLKDSAERRKRADDRLRKKINDVCDRAFDKALAAC
jgi:putative FmdB family regulatory protein